MSKSKETRLETPAIQAFAKAAKLMNERWTPHPGQVRILAPLIKGESTEVFVQCGRSYGKTESMCYLLWRWALAFPGSENYYFSPFMKQSREILWASNRLQQMGPNEEIASINATEMRIILTNGSFIKLDGSDNVDAYRGIKPKGITVFDEFKDFKPEFYEAYDPNRAAFEAPLFIIGTPPDHQCQFTDVAEQFRKSEHKRFFTAPSWENPHLSRRWLDQKKAELYARGEGDTWEREYEGKFVRGGSNKIFPMLLDSHVKPHSEIMRLVERDRRKLDWILWCDPAAASVFAVLFCAINRYTKTVYVLDEIYETAQTEMTVQIIGKRIMKMRDDLMSLPGVEWRQGYDEAEKWFANEMFSHFGEHFEPTQKMKHDKITGLTLIKDMLLQHKIVMSDRCKKLFWEMDNYRKDKDGKVVKTKDHCISGDMLVTTLNGYVPIKYVKEDDYVLTRDGFRRVLKKWDNGVKEIVEVRYGKYSLRCTSDHKIFTKNRGFVKADSLRYMDELVIDEKCLQKVSLLVRSSTDGIRIAQKTRLEIITDVLLTGLGRVGLDTRIIKYGLRQTDRLKKVIKFIILMATNLIITSTIWSYCPKKNTLSNIVSKGLSALQPLNILLSLRGLGHSQLNGTVLRLEKFGIQKMLKQYSVKKIDTKSRVSASIVDLNTCAIICAQKIKQSFAQIIASLRIGDPLAWMTKLGVVRFVVRVTRSISIQRRIHVQGVVVVNLNRSEDVYDLTIEKDHEFFANGILVHNCIDDIRYIISAYFYDTVNEKEPEESDNPKKWYKISDDFSGLDEFNGRIDEWE